MKTALICGVSGQDGAYLSRLLLSKGYRVHGASRDAATASFSNLVRLGIRDDVHVESVITTDFRGVTQAIERVQPDEIYNLAGQSSVGLSFEQPVATMESIAIGTLNLLEAIRLTNRPIRLYSAGSGESFGDTGGVRVNEDSPFRPRSPYAVAKAAAFWEVAKYREAYGLYACTGLLFNHESPLRPERFVTRKVAVAAARIAKGSGETLRLGNIDVRRDWGWAPEYVDAMWRMLQQPEPGDYIVATGKTHSLAEFIERAFAEVDLDWREHVTSDPALVRPSEIAAAQADPSRAERVLGWKATYGFDDVAREMVRAEMEGGGA